MEAGEHDILVVHSDREAPKIGCRVSLYTTRDEGKRKAGEEGKICSSMCH